MRQHDRGTIAVFSTSDVLDSVLARLKPLARNLQVEEQTVTRLPDGGAVYGIRLRVTWLADPARAAAPPFVALASEMPGVTRVEWQG
ncbi:MAG TPA: hypothetical protein VFB16_03245 [Bauldia sp.]|nr:hypothetical protein [Bauldia sp.]